MPFDPNDLSELDELTEEHLGFSALSDGLGFSKGNKGPHPASKKGQPAPPAKHLAGPQAPAGASARELPSMSLDEEEEDQLPSRSSGTGAVAGGPIWTAPSISQPTPPNRPTSTWSAHNPEMPQRPIPPSSAPAVFQAKPFTPSAPVRPTPAPSMPPAKAA